MKKLTFLISLTLLLSITTNAQSDSDEYDWNALVPYDNSTKPEKSYIEKTQEYLNHLSRQGQELLEQSGRNFRNNTKSIYDTAKDYGTSALEYTTTTIRESCRGTECEW